MRTLLLASIGLAVLGLAAMPLGAGGQAVVGRVLEEGTLRPLSGAFVVLRDTAGERRGAVLAGEDGRFALRAPVPGRYRLVARLIGYADATSAPFMIAGGETVERTLEVAVRAISLDGIRAEVGRRCHGRPEQGVRSARLWEEARKALEIAEWTEEQETLRFRIVERRRELEARTLRVISSRESGRRGFSRQSPYRSLPAEALARGGYVQPASDGWNHFAPDADVLLSESFLETHCFRATGGEAGLVGLAFEPVAGRDLPDVEGVLWLDEATAELRRLDFRYVHLPYRHGDWPQVGGRVEFERLTTGIWIVRRWRIRMPLEATWAAGRSGAQRLELRTIMEESAEVARVRTGSGELLSPAPPRARPPVEATGRGERWRNGAPRRPRPGSPYPRSTIRLPESSVRALQPGGSQSVALYSWTTAGPSSTVAGASASRPTTRASTACPRKRTARARTGEAFAPAAPSAPARRTGVAVAGPVASTRAVTSSAAASGRAKP